MTDQNDVQEQEQEQGQEQERERVEITIRDRLFNLIAEVEAIQQTDDACAEYKKALADLRQAKNWLDLIK